MLVRTDEKKLSFLFQETDMFFEMGYQLLEQEKPAQMLPYTRKRQNGREKLIFMSDAPGLRPVRRLEGSLGENEVLDMVSELFFLVGKIEENGFLKRECVWCRYENIYYDTERKMLKVALLPITGVRYAESKSWGERLRSTVARLTKELAPGKAEREKQLAQLLAARSITAKEALLEIESMRGGQPGLLPSEDAAVRLGLRLYYSGKNGILEFLVDDGDFIIGRNGRKADGVVDESVSRAVSRQHCFITRLGNKFFVQDLKSANHTRVNGIMIPPYELMQLEENDILSVADIDFRVTFLKK
ncbi:MAG: FHA domain-containing protein [Lachnospiraceae bacterium]|nr:FHA domain-containing protein [Lachnospiraceae bacterium]